MLDVYRNSQDQQKLESRNVNTRKARLRNKKSSQNELKIRDLRIRMMEKAPRTDIEDQARITTGLDPGSTTLRQQKDST